MAEVTTSRVNSSSRIIPLFDDPENNGDQSRFAGGGRREMRDGSMAIDGGGHDEFNPLDACLPITESRNGTTLTATFHLFCSAIGIQLLSLPIALLSLGW